MVSCVAVLFLNYSSVSHDPKERNQLQMWYFAMHLRVFVCHLTASRDSTEDKVACESGEKSDKKTNGETGRHECLSRGDNMHKFHVRRATKNE